MQNKFRGRGHAGNLARRTGGSTRRAGTQKRRRRTRRRTRCGDQPMYFSKSETLLSKKASISSGGSFLYESMAR